METLDKTLYGFVITADSSLNGQFVLEDSFKSPFKFVSIKDFKNNTVEIDTNNSFKIFQDKSYKSSSIIGGIFSEDFDELLMICPEVENEIISKQTKVENNYFQKNRIYYFQSKAYTEEETSYQSVITKEFNYDEIKTKSSSLKKIYAYYNDYNDTLTLNLDVNNKSILINSFKNIFEIDDEKIIIKNENNNNVIDEVDFFVYRCAIIASRASEKYGLPVELYYRHIFIPPQVKIKHTASINNEKEVIKDEVEILIDLGNTFSYQSNICNFIIDNSLKNIKFNNIVYKIKLIESNNECTCLSLDYVNGCIYSSFIQFVYHLTHILKIPTYSLYNYSITLEEIDKFFNDTKAKAFDVISLYADENKKLHPYHISELNIKTVYCTLPVLKIPFKDYINNNKRVLSFDTSFSCITLQGYIDYTTDQLYISEIHLLLPIIKYNDYESENLSDNRIKIIVIKILNSLNIKISKNLNFELDFTIEYIDKETIETKNIYTTLFYLLFIGVNSLKHTLSLDKFKEDNKEIILEEDKKK